MELEPLTCWVAVTGLAWGPHTPSIIVSLTALTVWPGCVVTAMMTAPAMACAPEELLVKCALLRVPTTVAGCETQRVVCVSDRLCWGWGAVLSGAGVSKMGVLGQSVHLTGSRFSKTQSSQQFLHQVKVTRPSLNVDLAP